MRVLVTGGAGYLGCHVVDALLDAGHEPIVLDNLSTGHRQAVSRSELIVGDIRNSELLKDILTRRRFDGVIHLAASSQVGESMTHPTIYFENNTLGGITLFTQVIAHNVPWVVLSSTAAVYGAPAIVPINEDCATDPLNPYGETKLMLEKILGWYYKAYGLRSMVLRYFNAAGAHPSGSLGEDHSPETHLVPIVLQAALRQRSEVLVYGDDYPTKDGTAVRDYVHVCDLARAHVSCLERLNSGSFGGTYNLGSASGYSVREVVDTAIAVTGRAIPTRIAPRRSGDPPTLIASGDKALLDLGWKRSYDLTAIIETAWKWHSTHPYGYRG